MAKSHEGQVYYTPDKPILHFGLPQGWTPPATCDKVESQPESGDPATTRVLQD